MLKNILFLQLNQKTNIMQENVNMKLVDTTSNPAPLGLLGFGMTTVLLNLANAGFTNKTSVILGMGIFVGGIAQVIAGIMEWKKNNTFGTLAFTSYGFFWITLVSIWVLPAIFPTVIQSISPAPHEMGWFLLLWGVFSTFMFIGTFKLSRALQVVFGLLIALFYLLAAAYFTEIHEIHIWAGYVGIICGLSAIYTSVAQVLNELWGREVMPICPMKK